MWILFIICFWNINRAACAVCDNGHFGSRCQYKCHCKTVCLYDGNCSGECEDGWFGLQCQYQNVVYFYKMAVSPINAETLFTNNNVCSNINTLNEVSIDWSTTLPFSWMRIKTKNNGALSTLRVSIKESNLESPCTNLRFFQVDAMTFDVYCDCNGVMTTLKLAGDIVASICTILVNGGRNVALFQNTSQTSTYSSESNFGPQKAVDGVVEPTCYNKGCSHTTNEPNRDPHPSWTVIFDQPYAIDKFVIYNRIDSSQFRLKHFSLEAFDKKNTSIFQYKDQSDIYQLVYTIVLQPALTVYQVIISQTEYYPTDTIPYVSINEFEAYGECSTGRYGLYCVPCTGHCDSQCRAIDGHCDVCFPGYKGDKCDEACPQGKYGPNCSGACSQHCFTENNCDNTNGNCAPCKPGYRGDTCNEECLNKTYGYYCMNHCSVGCSNICNKTDGQCNCLNGYKGNMCTEKCPNGTYGDKCAQNCSQFCVPSTCSSENGFCDCLPGYKGDKCDDVCSLGNWGPRCINNCSVHCYTTSCDFQTGSCYYGCIEGFQTANCTEPCNKTHYGKNCVNECSSNCIRSECNSTTGVCGECVPGRFGNYCDEDCPDGKYGQDCIDVCSISCKGGCHPVNGTCINGCQDGFLGPFCNETCDENHFGPACSSACSLHCEGVNNNNSRICHSVNGSCLLGCSRDFTGPQCFEAINSGSSPPVGAVVGAAIAALVIIALIIVAVVLWRRKHPRTTFKERNITHLILPEKDIEEKVSEEIETPKEDDDPGFIPDATYYNTSSEPLVNMSMPVHELNIYMKSHDKEFFTEQFKKIPQAQDVTTEVAENEKNKVKNRYKNICPYDHSRVHLLINTGKKEGDYINASYIRDNNDKVKFIASQGPNKAVLNDFIRMLWEQHVDIVVMLTNLVEEAKVKCEQYWPESGKVSYGDTKVQVIQAKTFADYTIRTIELNQYNGGTRILTQYHFTSWPDQSVPNSPWALVDLAMKVLAHPTTQPIVVHCSAGVGRTGTFIALHNVLKDAEETNRIDFYSTLVRLRQDRIFMIQTPDQYEFLHRAVQAALICTPTVVSVSDCSERVKELLKKEVSGLSKIEKEYRSINLVSKDIRNSQLDDNEVEKSTKEKVYQNTHELKKDGQNRFPNIMPRKFDRPYLVCEHKNMSDYINAVFTPALFKKDQHIITQLPMPQTVSDLWRLVKQYKISLMVAFELEKLGTDKTMTVYLPIVVDSSLALGNIEIHCTAINDKDLWEEQILKVRNEKSKSDSQDVVHLKCKDTEMDVKKLLSLVLKIRAYTAYTSGRTLFLCRNGATFSGLCSVLSTVLDRLDEDANVSVPLVVGAMKTVRPEVIPNLEQYRIVYEVLERYCTTASPYTNVGGEKLPLTTPLTIPLTIPSHIINNPTFDENSTDPSSVYNNV